MPVADPSLQSAVSSIYREHHSWLQLWLNRKLGCPFQAEDLAQNTFVRLIKSPDRDRLIEPRAFLTVLAQRELYSFWRRCELEKAFLQALHNLPEEFAPSTEELVRIRQQLAEIDALLAGLPLKVKQAFLMNRIEGRTHEDIGKTLGLSVATIERYMKQALIHCYVMKK